MLVGDVRVEDVLVVTGVIAVRADVAFLLAAFHVPVSVQVAPVEVRSAALVARILHPD